MWHKTRYILGNVYFHLAQFPKANRNLRQPTVLDSSLPKIDLCTYCFKKIKHKRNTLFDHVSIKSEFI